MNKSTGESILIKVNIWVKVRIKIRDRMTIFDFYKYMKNKLDLIHN